MRLQKEQVGVGFEKGRSVTRGVGWRWRRRDWRAAATCRYWVAAAARRYWVAMRRAAVPRDWLVREWSGEVKTGVAGAGASCGAPSRNPGRRR
jgi:hypothetical protein